MLARLDVEKEAAALAARENAVHCPDWLGARVLPNGSKGGYRILIETEGFTVKVLGVGHSQPPWAVCRDAFALPAYPSRRSSRSV